MKRSIFSLAKIGYVEEGRAESLCDEILPSSWDDVDLDMKVETAEDELSASSSLRKQKQWPRPSFPAFLKFKDNVETNTDILPSIDSLPISLPIGYGPLEEFDQVELLTKFKLQAKQNEFPVAKDLLTKNEVSTSTTHSAFHLHASSNNSTGANNILFYPKFINFFLG